jgi:hypothetical protein
MGPVLNTQQPSFIISQNLFCVLRSSASCCICEVMFSQLNILKLINIKFCIFFLHFPISSPSPSPFGLPASPNRIIRPTTFFISSKKKRRDPHYFCCRLIGSTRLCSVGWPALKCYLFDMFLKYREKKD